MKNVFLMTAMVIYCLISNAQEKKEISDDMYGKSKTKSIGENTNKLSATHEGARHFNPNETSQLMYAQLLGTTKFMSSKVTVEIDFGQERAWINTKDNNRIIDPKTGKPFVFNSMVDAMNYMGSLGWKFIQAYVVTSSNQNVYHWLLSKEVDEDMSDDLPSTKRDLKK